MASYQTYSDVGTYSSRLVSIVLLNNSHKWKLTFQDSEIKREKIPYSITTSSEGCKPMTTLDDSLPRTLLQPLAMNSPLNAEHFAIWPPTPRNPSDLDQRTTADPEHYMYSTAESLGGQDAISPWDPALGIVHENSPPPVSEQELPTSNCGSSVEGEQ